MKSRAPAWLEWVGRHELATLAALLIVAGAVWIFAELADEVIDGETQAVDEILMLALREDADPANPLGPPWAEELARDVTGLGSAGILVLLTLASSGFLFLQGKPHLALYVLGAVASGTVVSSLLKAGFDRPRPELAADHLVYTSSFPSGHAMMSAVAFLTLGALLATAQTGLGMKAYLLALASLLTLLVGLSRVYLGVHYPTDVLAGWTAGAAWALSCWMIARYLRRRGAVE